MSEATVRWFGASWGAPVCEPELHIDTPVGLICAGHEHLHEDRLAVILPEDQGVTTPYLSERGVERIAYHLDCWLHEVGADRIGRR